VATDTSVLVVGGSLNGLTTALMLAHRHIPCVVVERHPGTTVQIQVSRHFTALDGDLPESRD
jgi:2-polyprenyl-6-methoxyphenol hydroxylase-like FAD-dependent oxidoreductase